MYRLGLTLLLDVGSHNFTEGAWGRLSSKSLRISNTELGVVLPVKARTLKEADTKLSEMVCWSRPANACEFASHRVSDITDMIDRCWGQPPLFHR